MMMKEPIVGDLFSLVGHLGGKFYGSTVGHLEGKFYGSTVGHFSLGGGGVIRL